MSVIRALVTRRQAATARPRAHDRRHVHRQAPAALLLALLTLLWSLACACVERPTTSTEGLGRACPVAGCAEGQQCVTANGMSTCEIPCDSDVECPDGFRCNLPPILPGSLPNVCVDA